MRVAYVFTTSPTPSPTRPLGVPYTSPTSPTKPQGFVRAHQQSTHSAPPWRLIHAPGAVPSPPLGPMQKTSEPGQPYSPHPLCPSPSPPHPHAPTHPPSRSEVCDLFRACPMLQFSPRPNALSMHRTHGDRGCGLALADKRWTGDASKAHVSFSRRMCLGGQYGNPFRPERNKRTLYHFLQRALAAAIRPSLTMLAPLTHPSQTKRERLFRNGKPDPTSALLAANIASSGGVGSDVPRTEGTFISLGTDPSAMVIHCHFSAM